MDYDCQTCGACCRYESPDGLGFYVTPVTAEDRKRLPLHLVHKGVMKKIQGSEGPRCIALEGKVGKHCTCRVYDRRPTICREYEVGGPLCRKARQEAGLT